MAENITFFVIGIVLIVSAILVVSRKNVFHATLFLMLFLFSMAAMFVHLKAEFVAVLQVLAYVGGVTTFILFVLMLTNRMYDRTIESKKTLAGRIIFVALLAAVMIFIVNMAFLQPLKNLPVNFVSDITVIGKLMVSDYLLSFELISIILTVSMIGAIILVKKEGP